MRYAVKVYGCARCCCGMAHGASRNPGGRGEVTTLPGGEKRVKHRRLVALHRLGHQRLHAHICRAGAPIAGKDSVCHSRTHRQLATWRAKQPDGPGADTRADNRKRPPVLLAWAQGLRRHLGLPDAWCLMPHASCLAHATPRHAAHTSSASSAAPRRAPGPGCVTKIGAPNRSANRKGVDSSQPHLAVDRQPAADARKHGHRLAGGLAQGWGRACEHARRHELKHALQRAYMPSWRLGVAAHLAGAGVARGKQGK